MAEQDIERFLSLQTEGGLSLEIDRVFSIDLFAAQQKMGRYSLPRPSAWVLKFVQAATEAECGDLSPKLGRDEISVGFQGNPFRSLDSLCEALDSLKPANLAEDHLFGGLLAALATRGEVLVEHGPQRWRPTVGSEVEASENDSPSLRVLYRPPRQGFWERLRGRLSFGCGLMDELQTNCFVCPVQMDVDSRPLHPGHDEVPLLSALLSGVQGSHLDLYGQLLSDTGNKSRTFCRWGSKRPEFAAYAVQIRLVPEGKASLLSIDWVRSGVVVQREELEIVGKVPMLVRILVPTRGLEFDATGFAVRDSEEADIRRAQAVSYLTQATEALKGEIQKGRRWQKYFESLPVQVGCPHIDDMTDQLNNFLLASRRYL